MELVKQFLAYGILAYWAAVFTWHFIMVKIYGVIQVTESNPYMLWIELIGCLLVFLLAVERLVKEFKHWRKK